MREIAIIGCGQVGSQVATLLAARGLVDQLDLLDQDDQRVIGLANDLGDAWPQLTVRFQDWSSLNRADVVVLAIGSRKLLSDNRFGELAFNAQAVADMARRVKKKNVRGVVINLSNPNEALTAFIQQAWALPPKQVIGSGTVLDTIRLRRVVAKQTQTAYGAVAGFVAGQHDGDLFFPSSTWRVNGQAIDQDINGHTVDSQKALVAARMNGYRILEGLGSDYLGLANAAVRIIQAILQDSGEAFSLAVNQPQYGGYVSFPVQVGRRGIGNYVLLPLEPVENEQIKVAASAIKAQLAAMQASLP